MWFTVVLLLGFLTSGQCQTPKGFSPASHNRLDVQFNDGEILKPGMTLLAKDTQQAPIVEVNTSLINTNGGPLMVILFDPDAVYDGHETTALHWYEPFMTPVSSTTSSGKAVQLQPNALLNAAYVGPRPPPGPAHRYIFLLIQHDMAYSLPTCYSRILNPEPASAERLGFDLWGFLEEAGLKDVVAATWFWGRHSAGSGTVSSSKSSVSLSKPVCGTSGPDGSS